MLEKTTTETFEMLKLSLRDETMDRT